MPGWVCTDLLPHNPIRISHLWTFVPLRMCVIIVYSAQSTKQGIRQVYMQTDYRKYVGNGQPPLVARGPCPHLSCLNHIVCNTHVERHLLLHNQLGVSTSALFLRKSTIMQSEDIRLSREL